MTKNKKNKRWIHPRHTVVRHTLGIFFHLYCKMKYGATIKRFKEEKKRQYLVLFNHQTGFDQFFVALSFRQHLYFIASEDIFSKGFLSTLLRFLVAPIPIKKQSTDVRAILNCIKVAKEGGSIALAPEGNRTYCGKIVNMAEAIAPLARKLNLPIVLYRIEGGYGVQPRWADNVRRGKMKCYVSEVIEPETYQNMSDEQLLDRIRHGLDVNEAKVDGFYYHKNNAEYLERVMYYCPKCGFSVFESKRDIVRCKKCGIKIRHLPTKELEGIGEKFPYRFVADWYSAQVDYVNSIDTREYCDKPIWNDDASLSLVIPYKKKQKIFENAKIELYGDRIYITQKGEELKFPMSDISAISVLGRNKVNIYHKGDIYQIKGDKHFNGLKFVNLCYREKNIRKGDNNGFLGL